MNERKKKENLKERKKQMLRGRSNQRIKEKESANKEERIKLLQQKNKIANLPVCTIHDMIFYLTFHKSTNKKVGYRTCQE